MLCASCALALISLGGCSGNDPGVQIPTRLPATVQIQITDGGTFVPADVWVASGQRVVWTNYDSGPHGILVLKPSGTALPASSATYAKGIAPGEQYTWRVPPRMGPAAVITYICPIHREMTGILRVR